MTAETEPLPATEPDEQSSKVPRWVAIIAALTLLAGVVGVIVYGYLTRPGWVGVSDKKFWDYLELLIVPAALAFGVYWLNRRQDERERTAEEARRERELEVENQRAQDEALQAYLDQISQLLLDSDRPLRQSKEGDEVRTLARARTLTVLTRLDARHNRSVLHFLRDSQLIGEREQSIISFSGADLRGADLWRADLRGADLRGTDLQRANLWGANLEDADLRGAQLGEANLGSANLTNANLSRANLSGATYRGYRPPGIAYVKGIEMIWPADLTDAYLAGANLTDANLVGVKLWGTYLYGAELSGTVLGDADLSATYFEDEQLARAMISDDATMPRRTKYTKPRGTTYGDWRKAKERSEEDGST